MSGNERLTITNQASSLHLHKGNTKNGASNICTADYLLLSLLREFLVQCTANRF